MAAGGVCFFLPGLGLPRRISFKPALIILDLRYSRWSKRVEELVPWASKVSPGAGVLGLFTLGDIVTSAALKRGGFEELPWDHAAIETCDWSPHRPAYGTPTSVIDWRLDDVPGYLARSHEIVEMEAPPAVTTLIDGIARLLQEQATLDIPDIRRSRWLLATLRQLPVPVRWYEEAARSLGRSTIRRMISHLGARSARIPDELGPVIQTLRMAFDHLYSELEKDNPRSPVLLKTVLAAVNGSQLRTLVVVRDAVMERATRNWFELEAFQHRQGLAGVDVHGCPSFESISTSGYATAIFNGALPQRYRWIAGAALAPRVVFICYPEDSDVVEKQLRSFYESGPRALATAARERLCARLAHATPADYSAAKERPAPTLRLLRPPKKEELRSVPAKRTKLTALEGGFAALKDALAAAERAAEELRLSQVTTPIEWAEETIDEDTLLSDLQDGGSSSIDADDVDCQRIHLHSPARGRGYVLALAGEPVEAIRPRRPSDILRLLPRDLKVGDVLLRMEDGRRAGLFDRIVELAERQPRLQNLAEYRTRWRTAVSQLAQRYASGGLINYGRMLTDLRSAGAPIETEIALRFWVKDLVIGPERSASIVAVGRVIGDEMLVAAGGEFDQAFRRIRGIRQGIGRRLNGAIRRSFQHVQLADVTNRGESLDDSLGLPLDELVESLDLAEVLAVDPPQLAPAYLVDRFLVND
ncbi:MAG: DrmE family protein [Candidatus Dormibacteria bacterium]